MKELTTVYIPKTETHEYGIFFTQEEYNKHIEEVIKNTLKVAAENSEAIEGWSTGFSGNAASVDKESITNTFNQSYNKWKI